MRIIILTAVISQPEQSNLTMQTTLQCIDVRRYGRGLGETKCVQGTIRIWLQYSVGLTFLALHPYEGTKRCTELAAMCNNRFTVYEMLAFYCAVLWQAQNHRTQNASRRTEPACIPKG